MIEKDLVLGPELATASPAIAFRPKCQRRQERRSANSGPRIVRLLVVGCKVQEVLARRRKIATTLIDSAVKPLTEEKPIAIPMPPNKEHLFARAPTKYDGYVRFPSEQDKQPTRRG